VDKEARTVLTQRQSVTNQENALKLLPVQRRLLEALLARSQARLEAARLDLARTTVTLPFTARIAEVNVEADQFVRVGEILVVAEVLVQPPIQRFRNVVETRGEPIREIPEGDLGQWACSPACACPGSTSNGRHGWCGSVPPWTPTLIITSHAGGWR
jgi:multidrug efflux pump subunit AcrA (membrane-fusion protein)